MHCYFIAKPRGKRLQLVEGDMLLKEEQVQVYNQLKNGRVRRGGIKDYWLWPKGIIYYSFANDLGEYFMN